MVLRVLGWQSSSPPPPSCHPSPSHPSPSHPSPSHPSLLLIIIGSKPKQNWKIKHVCVFGKREKTNINIRASVMGWSMIIWLIKVYPRYRLVRASPACWRKRRNIKDWQQRRLSTVNSPEPWIPHRWWDNCLGWDASVDRFWMLSCQLLWQMCHSTPPQTIGPFVVQDNPNNLRSCTHINTCSL